MALNISSDSISISLGDSSEPQPTINTTDNNTNKILKICETFMKIKKKLENDGQIMKIAKNSRKLRKNHENDGQFMKIAKFS